MCRRFESNDYLIIERLACFALNSSSDKARGRYSDVTSKDPLINECKIDKLLGKIIFKSERFPNVMNNLRLSFSSQIHMDIVRRFDKNTLVAVKQIIEEIIFV